MPIIARRGVFRYNFRLVSDWEALFNEEITNAKAALQRGNAGLARVCARRALNHVLGEYLRRKALPDPGPSVIERGTYLVNAPGLAEEVRTGLGYFLLRVTPEHNLPVNVDLISEAQRLQRVMLGDAAPPSHP